MNKITNFYRKISFLSLMLCIFITYAPSSLADEYIDDDYNEFSEEAFFDEDDGTAGVASFADPYESFNRSVFEFNQFVDAALLGQLAELYIFLVPDWGRDRITNFTSNLKEPITFVNSVLQGDAENALTSFWRFAINSSFGVLGTFEAAEEVGLKKRSEGFGQTLAVWGWTDSDYIVLPFIGPSTTRDTIGYVVDKAFDPTTYDIVSEGITYTYNGIDLLNTRAGLNTQIKALNQAIDPYTVMKSSYIQNINRRINNE